MAQPRSYAGGIRETVKSFWHGLSITLSYLFRRPMTVQYPDRTPMPVRDMLPPRYRGFLEVDTTICTGCQACERACPINCIQITLEKDATNPKQRVVTQFDIDEAKCMFCGLCVEPCPTGSIQHTREFEGSQRNIRNLTIRWADPLAPFPVYKVDKNAEYYPRAPLGSLVRAKFDAHAWNAPGPTFLPPEPAGAAKPKAQPKAAAAAAGAAPAAVAAGAAHAAAAPAARAVSAAPKAAPTNGVPADGSEKPVETAPAAVAAPEKVAPPAKPAASEKASVEKPAAEPAVTPNPETK